MGIPGAMAPEVIIIDDPVSDSREITPEMRERMTEWWREYLVRERERVAANEVEIARARLG